jgi:hypothetical protein
MKFLGLIKCFGFIDQMNINVSGNILHNELRIKVCFNSGGKFTEKSI